jgi:ubiquinone/menaquinone biosynthesis C-methylase UbiE
MTGFLVSQAIYVAAKLGVADILKDGPMGANEIATITGGEPENLYRVMRLLVSEGVFDQQEDGRFCQNSLSDFLRSDLPDSARWWALNMGDEQYKAAGNMIEAVKSGEPQFDRIYGMPFFAHLQENSEAADVFNRAMGTEGPREKYISEAYNFGQFKKIVDVGGGYGKMLQTILSDYPNLRGIVYDLPSSEAGFRERTREAGLEDRLEFISGSFFESVPAGGDAYFISTVIHDWGNDKAAQILRNCYKVMEPGHKLLIAEQVLGSDKLPSLAKRLDMTMMVIFGGQERTQEEFRELLTSTGFELQQIVRTHSRFCILEAIRK